MVHSEVRKPDAPVQRPKSTPLAALTRLRWLDLGRTATGDATSARLKGLHHLEVLRMGLTALTDIGMKNLSGLSRLRWLDLSGTGVGTSAL